MAEHYEDWVENKEETRNSLLNMLSEKMESEEQAASPEEKQLMLENLEKEIEEQMRDASKSYQQAKHDCLLARAALKAYRPLESINEKAVVLLNEMVDYASSQVAAVESVMNIYEVVTMEEITLLKQANFHPKFVEKVNDLVESIEAVDYKTRESIVKALTEQVPPIKLPEVDNVVPDMLQYLGADENESR